MPHVQKHEPGSFAWVELATSDQTAAKSFYTTLFGWEYTDSPMGPGETYTMFRLEGREAGAAYTLRPEQKNMGVPPHWILYIAVASADETAKRAAELGGQVVAGPFDVFTYGRMAVIIDPTGAAFCIWEAKAHSGLGISGQNGTFCWADLSTPDQAGAAKFYSELFGWKLETGEHGGEYLHIINNGNYIGGVPGPSQRAPHTPPHWLLYFQVDDCDAATGQARQLGANTYMPPMTMENVGRFSVVADPQGAAFSLFQPMSRATESQA